MQKQIQKVGDLILQISRYQSSDKWGIESEHCDQTGSVEHMSRTVHKHLIDAIKLEN